MSFKEKNSVQKRMQEALRITTKYPDKIPVICEKSNSTRDNLPKIDKNKYLVPNDLIVSQFIQVIRNKLRIDAHVAIFLIVGDFIPTPMTTISDLYYHHRDNDGFLYVTYAAENTFGTKKDTS